MWVGLCTSQMGLFNMTPVALEHIIFCELLCWSRDCKRYKMSDVDNSGRISSKPERVQVSLSKYFQHCVMAV